MGRFPSPSDDDAADSNRRLSVSVCWRRPLLLLADAGVLVSVSVSMSVVLAFGGGGLKK
jgi:hypothetical protein